MNKITEHLLFVNEELEKARTKGAKDKQKRKLHPGSIKSYLEENPADRRARKEVTAGDEDMARRGYSQQSMDEMMEWADRHVLNNKIVGQPKGHIFALKEKKMNKAVLLTIDEEFESLEKAKFSKKVYQHADTPGAGTKKRKHLKGQDKVHAVMGEFKRGTLYSGKSKKKVTKREQAVAIGLSEAGLSKPKK